MDGGAPTGLVGGAERRTRLVWLTLFRIVAISLSLAAIAARLMAQLPRELALSDTLAFATIGAAYVLTLGHALRLRRGYASVADAVSHVAGDIVIATALVILTGGAESPFTFAYSLAVIGAAMLLDVRGALTAAAVSMLVFAVVVAGLQSGLAASPMGPTHLAPARVVFLLVSNMLAFSLVAVLAGYLSRQLSAAGGQLVAREADLRKLGEQHEQILAAMPSGLVTCGPTGEVTYMNRAACLILGRRQEEVVGTQVEALFPGVTAMRASSARRERTVSSPNGPRTVGFSVTPLRSGTGELLIVFQDLTELRRVEEDLRRADRLAALGTLAAQLAHEIRNPLASMRGSAQLIADAPAQDAASPTLARILVREADRLSRLVEDFLRFARPPEPQRRWVDLGSLVQETVAMLQGDPLAQQVGLEVAAAGVEAQVDPDQFRQVLLNLVRNALQAAGPGGTVQVGLEERAGWARLRVWDSAGSIPPSLMPRLFEPFFTTRDGGTGLGLSTAHSLVNAHGGSIRVRSSREEGTEFLVTLPLQPVEQQSHARPGR